jgi:predicted Holliday junction resolvase-like endonuclease
MIYTILAICLLLGALYIANIYRKQVEVLKFQMKEMQEEFEKEKVKVRADAKKRSGAVNWGKSVEHFVPFMTKFPIPPEDVVFLGMPIDYVGFTNTGSTTKCEVHFIEVKSGNAFLMQKQKNIKKAIEDGRVKWHEISVEGNSVKD